MQFTIGKMYVPKNLRASFEARLYKTLEGAAASHNLYTGGAMTVENYSNLGQDLGSISDHGETIVVLEQSFFDFIPIPLTARERRSRNWKTKLRSCPIQVYRVLTSDGLTGWCIFSDYSLDRWKEV